MQIGVNELNKTAYRNSGIVQKLQLARLCVLIFIEDFFIIMIYCHKIPTLRIIKIIGIFQIILAIIATSIGIAITFRFSKVHQETDSEYETAIDYVDTPWTTKYCAGVWIGLLLLVAGGFNSISDIRPEKTKFIYASIALNFAVAIFSILLIINLGKVLTWFKSCSYTYHDGETISRRYCSEQDKQTGVEFYWTFIITLVLVIPLALMNNYLIFVVNSVLFEGFCTGLCFRKIIYKYKGSTNRTISIKTKNTREFDQEMIELPLQEISQHSNAL